MYRKGEKFIKTMVKECIEQMKLCEHEKCTGCTACFSICPTNSITMKEDSYAEMHPFINNKTCIRCGLCMKACPQMHMVKFYEPYICYAAWNSNHDDCINSSSGGVATLLAKSVIKQKGVYYGVEFSRNSGTYFKRITKYEEISRTQGSKYVQADLGLTFREIGRDLSDNRLVMFVGSPCQVAGLKKYVQNSRFNSYNNLLTVDFLCHGTVPQKYLMEEIAFIEKKYSFKADECIFRSNRPERNYRLTLLEKDTIFYQKRAENNIYFYCFLRAITCRDSCMNCEFKQKNRVGDITIGDFIGLGQEIPFDFARGINPSLVFVNSEKGKTQIDSIIDKVTLITRPISEAVKGGPSLKKENLSSKERSIFRRRYIKYGFISSTNNLKYIMMINMYISEFKNMFIKGTKKIIKRCK